MGQFLNCPTFVKIYEISAFFYGKTGKNMIKYYGLFYFCAGCKKVKYDLKNQNKCSIMCLGIIEMN